MSTVRLTITLEVPREPCETCAAANTETPEERGWWFLDELEEVPPRRKSSFTEAMEAQKAGGPFRFRSDPA